jgi:hypothetical protein
LKRDETRRREKRGKEEGRLQRKEQGARLDDKDNMWLDKPLD